MIAYIEMLEVMPVTVEVISKTNVLRWRQQNPKTGNWPAEYRSMWRWFEQKIISFQSLSTYYLHCFHSVPRILIVIFASTVEREKGVVSLSNTSGGSCRFRDFCLHRLATMPAKANVTTAADATTIIKLIVSFLSEASGMLRAFGDGLGVDVSWPAIGLGTGLGSITSELLSSQGWHSQTKVAA